MGSLVFEHLARAYPDYNVIQTGHPWVSLESSRVDDNSGAQLLDALANVQEQYPNARFAPTSDVEPLLAAADLMVGDHSSVMTSYSLLDRPILFYCPSGSEFVNGEFLELYRDASHAFENTDELLVSSKLALAYPDQKSEGRARMRNTFYANQGHAANAAARTLVDLGRIGSSKRKS